MKAKCPNNPKHNQFVTSVSEIHEWKVDGNGNFIDDLGCKESGKPDIGNIWECAECGEKAVFEE